MAATNQNFSIWQGDSKTLRIPLKYPDGSLPNLEDATAKWWMSLRAADIVAIVEKTTEDSGIFILDNEVYVVLEPADTEDVAAGSYYHELKVFLASGAIGAATTGTVKLHNSVIPST